jgi:hypothetical protein
MNKLIHLKKFEELLEELDHERFAKRKWLNINLSPEEINRDVRKMVDNSIISQMNLGGRFTYLNDSQEILPELEPRKLINEKMSRILILRYLLELKRQFDTVSAGNIFEEYIAAFLQGKNIPGNDQIKDVESTNPKTKGVYQIKFINQGSSVDKMKMLKYLTGMEKNEYQPPADYLMLVLKKYNSDNIVVCNIVTEKFRKAMNLKPQEIVPYNQLDDFPQVQEFLYTLYKPNLLFKKDIIEILSDYDFVDRYDLDLDDLEGRVHRDLEDIYTELKNTYDSLKGLITDVNELVSGVNMEKEQNRDFSEIIESTENNTSKFTQSLQKLISKLGGKSKKKKFRFF